MVGRPIISLRPRSAIGHCLRPKAQGGTLVEIRLGVFVIGVRDPGTGGAVFVTAPGVLQIHAGVLDIHAGVAPTDPGVVVMLRPAVATDLAVVATALGVFEI